MTMSADELKSRLQNETFTLPGGDLAIPAADALFIEHLDGTLTITSAILSDNTSDIVVSGDTTLPSMTTGSKIVARFLCDANRYVTSIDLEITYPTWTVESGRLHLDLAFLSEGFDSLALRLTTRTNRDGALFPFAGIAVDVALPGSDRVRLVSSSESGSAGEHPSTHVLTGEFDPVSLLNLDALTGLPFAHDVQLPPLPDEVTSLFEALTLVDLRLSLDLSSRRIRAAWLDVHLAESWNVIPDVIELTGIGASFSLFLPTEPARDASVVVTASAEIADVVTAAVSISVPELILTTQVTTPVDLFPAAREFLQTASEDMPQQGSHLSAVIDLRAKRYALSFGVDAPWPIIPDTLELKDLELTMSGAQDQSWAGSLQGAFIIDDKPVHLSASYEQGRWEIGGAAYGIRFAPLADWLLQHYQITVPPTMAEFALDELSVTCTKQARRADFALRCAGTFPIMDMLLNVNLTVSLTRKVWHWVGELLIDVPSDAAGDNLMRFVITFDTSPQATRFTASWSDTQGVSLADLALILGLDLAQLPTAFIPELTDVGFVYDTDHANHSTVLYAAFEHIAFVLVSTSLASARTLTSCPRLPALASTAGAG
ncbi:hypothetical protein [Streptomyces noursei]|uniref:hypothetical protein n=1 Tax=Streptomyces noursei TaxID=1971 RepID=UPI00167B4303|nr:hypothetical protein [Streptomyces noursei]MCZ1021246.1 hypothetical protein [Streptomyces noursei]GGX56909.1 hypothetical protein GCM10010341_91560 [Streptomyces noursei]